MSRLVTMAQRCAGHNKTHLLARLDGHLKELVRRLFKVQRRFEREVNRPSQRNEVGLGHVLDLNALRVLARCRGGRRCILILFVVIVVLRTSQGAGDGTSVCKTDRVFIVALLVVAAVTEDLGFDLLVAVLVGLVVGVKLSVR